MKKIKYFIASAENLKKEREAIYKHLSEKNKKLVSEGIFIEVVMWEALSSSFSETRKQDEFNKALLESDALICIIYDKVGQFTLEEFQKAHESFKNGNKPYKIYVYFKVSKTPLNKLNKKSINDVLNLKDEIKKEEQIYNEYKNIEELLSKIDKDFNQDFEQLVKTKKDIHTLSNTVVSGGVLDNILNENLNEKLIILLNEINPEILIKYKELQNPICVMLSDYNRNSLKNIEKPLADANIFRCESNGNVIMGGIDNRIGNCLNDLADPPLNGYNFYFLENFKYKQ